MLNQKITRKEFLLGGLSLAALLVASKIPAAVKKLSLIKENKPEGSNAQASTAYGHNSYGGKKNV